jgi:hypothetical protein
MKLSSPKWICSCRTSVDCKIKYAPLWSSPIEWLKKKSVAYWWIEVRVPVHTFSLIWTDFMTFVMFMSASFVLLRSSACCSSHWLITRVVIHFRAGQTHIFVSRAFDTDEKRKYRLASVRVNHYTPRLKTSNDDVWLFDYALRSISLYSSATFKRQEKKSENTDWTKVATPPKAIRMW